MTITAQVRREIEQIVDERIVRSGAGRGGMLEVGAAIQRLTEAQERTEARIAKLAEAQERTDARIGELAAAQARTGARMDEMAQSMSSLSRAQERTEIAMQDLARAMTATRSEVGGLSQSMSYALENEAFRALPDLLLERHGIEISDRVVRAEVAGEEVNFLARGRRAGRPVLVVGETKLRLAERPYRPDFAEAVFGQLELKIAAARRENPDVEIVPLLVTHFASSQMLRDAASRGVLVIQSFEW